MYISRGHYPTNSRESNGKQHGKFNGVTAERRREPSRILKFQISGCKITLTCGALSNRPLV